MKLKLLREHYQSNDNVNWYPKQPFNNKEEIREKLGYDPEKCNLYTCGVCSKIHIASYPMKNRNNQK